MPKPNAGKWAEKEVQTWLNAASTQAHDFSWHRFPDAKAARGALAAQPADYLVVERGNVYLVEVKETAQTNRLPKAKVSQWSSLKKFYWAGAVVVVLVYMSAIDKWVWLNEIDLGMTDEDCPSSFLLTNKPTFSTAAEALQEIFR